MIDKNEEIKWETAKEGCLLAAIALTSIALIWACPLAVGSVGTSLESGFLMAVACKVGDDL